MPAFVFRQVRGIAVGLARSRRTPPSRAAAAQPVLTDWRVFSPGTRRGPASEAYRRTPVESESPCGSAPEGLPEILLGHLQAARAHAWPGCDGMTVDDALALYPEAVAAGLVPDWQELLRRHPELGEELHAWLAATDRWQFAF